jgi:hypothetical protein
VAWLAVGQVPVLLDEVVAQRDPQHVPPGIDGVAMRLIEGLDASRWVFTEHRRTDAICCAVAQVAYSRSTSTWAGDSQARRPPARPTPAAVDLRARQVLQVLLADSGSAADRPRVREIDDDEDRGDYPRPPTPVSVIT